MLPDPAPLPPLDYQMLFEAAPAAYLVLTPDLRIVAASDAYLQATMTTREQVLGRPMFDVFPDNPDESAPTGVRNLRASFERVLRGGVTDVMAIQKYDIRRPDNVGGGFEERYWSPVNSPVFGEGHQLTYLFHRVEDVTRYIRLTEQEKEHARQTQELRERAEQMEAEIYLRGQQLQEANRSLQHANEALQELDRVKTAFFSNVSHEFRTPLTLLLGPLEDLLADPALAPHLQEQLALIQRNGRRLLKLVNTLLDFSRIQAGRLQAVYIPTDLAALTADLASVFRSLLEKAGLHLLVECPELSEPVYVDQEMWEKIVLNLLSNAFKFTWNGEVAVTLRENGRQVELVVRDTGTGIPSAELPHLFERFHRVQESHARTYEGSGIGLALVQELVHLHGGTICVESQVGVGTTVTITLPQGLAHLSADRIQTSPSPSSTTRRGAPFVEEASRWLTEDRREEGHAEVWWRSDVAGTLPAAVQASEREETAGRLLLADDNADLRVYLTRLLSAHYEVVAVANGAAALAVARTHPPDVVLADVMMPILDGFGLLRALRADPRLQAIPVILLSARAGEEATIEGLEAGADEYLIKPFSAREVLARVATQMALARLHQEMQRGAEVLERRVAERTAELAQVNADLRQLLAERVRAGEQLRQLSQRVLEVQEAERRRVARELHDEIGQALTGVKLLLDLAGRTNGAGTSLEEAHRAIDEALARVRTLSLDLRPAMLDTLGLLIRYNVPKPVRQRACFQEVWMPWKDGQRKSCGLPQLDCSRKGVLLWLFPWEK